MTRLKENLFIKETIKINEDLIQHAHKKTIFMHCLPAHRNEEVTNSVIDGKRSVVWQQVQNRMYVQQSILNYCILWLKEWLDWKKIYLWEKY